MEFGQSAPECQSVNYEPAATPGAELYFTAGPNHGSGGLFAYLTAVSTQLFNATINKCSPLSTAIQMEWTFRKVSPS